MAISNNSTGLRPGVCTSTTRPTAPYEGQHIYETDTDIEYVWNGSAWVVNYVSAASPAFTGTPTAPTAADGTNTTQLATTAHVQTALGSWQDWTPAPLSSIGTITSYTSGGRYIRIKNTVILKFSIAISNKGTGDGTLVIPLPVTAHSSYGTVLGSSAVGTFNEWTVTGYTGNTFLLNGNTQLGLLRYNWTSPVQVGTLSGFAIYEAA